jgi:hypothetical protein
MKKVELLGTGVEVEFDENDFFNWREDDGTIYDAVMTNDDRIIVWHDGQNGWVQVK